MLKHLITQYENTLNKIKNWAAQQPNVEIHYVQHKEVMEAPFMQAMLMNDFFEGTLQVEKMGAVVDRSLYREQLSNS